MNHERTAEEEQVGLIEEYKQKRLQIFERNPGAVAEILNNRALELRSGYSDSYNYTMFYVLADDTPPPQCSKFDFPGNASVIIFLDQLEQKFPGEKQN